MIYHTEDKQSFIWVFNDEETKETRLHWGTYDKGTRAYKGSVTLPKNTAKFFTK
jgi:hypothetical protein